MRLTRHRSLSTAVAACVALTVAMPATTAAAAPQAGASPTVRAGTTPTPYAFNGSAFGTLVKGGDLPANSGRSALAYISCTKLAGKSRANHLAQAGLDGEGTAYGVQTRTWTTRRVTADGPVVNNFSTTNIASARLGTLRLKGIALRTRAWHDSDGFHAKRTASISKLLVDGVPGEVPTAPGQVMQIPGVGTLTFLSGRQGRSRHGAFVTARAVQLDVEGSTSTVILGSTYSAINDESPAGVMRGFGRALDATGLDGGVSSGKIAVQPLPCRGTDGKWKVNDTVGVDLGGQIAFSGASGSARGDQANRNNGYAMTRGNVTSASLAGGTVLLTGIRGQANVRLDNGRLKRSIEGTTLGSLTIDGQPQELPAPGETIDLAGLGTLTYAKRIRPNARNAVHVIAVQLRLIDDTPGQTIVNLGVAKVAYSRN